MRGPDDSKSFAALVELLNFRRKRDAERHCRTLVVTKGALTDLILGGRVGAVAPYVYAVHFSETVGEHLQPTPEEIEAMSRVKVGRLEGKALKFTRKIGQVFAERRLFAAHLFYTPAKRYWHLFYFDQRDKQAERNHWKHGAHIHYTSDLFLSTALDDVWRRVVVGDTGSLRSVHVRYDDSYNRHLYGGVRSVLTAQKPRKAPTATRPNLP